MFFDACKRLVSASGAVAVSLLGAGVWWAAPAQASTGVSCLLMGKALEVQQQPLSELMLKLQVQGVRDDNTQRNDVECSKQFKAGSHLWVSLNARKFKEDRQPRAGERIWLSFRYGDDRSGAVWRKYEVISQGDYMERKNGIQ